MKSRLHVHVLQEVFPHSSTAFQTMQQASIKTDKVKKRRSNRKSSFTCLTLRKREERWILMFQALLYKNNICKQGQEHQWEAKPFQRSKIQVSSLNSEYLDRKYVVHNNEKFFLDKCHYTNCIPRFKNANYLREKRIR